jgi:hypothetical protein
MKGTGLLKFKQFTESSATRRGFNKFWDVFSNEEILECLKDNGFTIMMFSNPSEEYQLVAVKSRIRAIEVIKYPTDKVCQYVISQSPNYIQYIKNPSKNTIQHQRMLWEI